MCMSGGGVIYLQHPDWTPQLHENLNIPEIKFEIIKSNQTKLTESVKDIIGSGLKYVVDE